MAVLGLRFCARAFSSCGKWGPLFIAVRGPLTIAASLVAEHRLQTHRLSNCGSRTQLLRGVWDLPRPGLEPVSPALAGRFSTTAPPGKPSRGFKWLFSNNFHQIHWGVSSQSPSCCHWRNWSHLHFRSLYLTGLYLGYGTLNHYRRLRLVFKKGLILFFFKIGFISRNQESEYSLHG